MEEVYKMANAPVRIVIPEIAAKKVSETNEIEPKSLVVEDVLFDVWRDRFRISRTRGLVN